MAIWTSRNSFCGMCLKFIALRSVLNAGCLNRLSPRPCRTYIRSYRCCKPPLRFVSVFLQTMSSAARLCSLICATWVISFSLAHKQTVRRAPHLKAVLSYVLAFGNFMNAGTSRGQADGFHLEILPRLRDVKTKDNSSNLLAFLVQTCFKELVLPAAEDNKKICPVPLPSNSLALAAESSFDDITAKLTRIKTELSMLPVLPFAFYYVLPAHSTLLMVLFIVNCGRKVYTVVAGAEDDEHLLPFKNVMEDFLSCAEQSLQQKITLLAVST